MSSQERVLVTGASGFLGSRIVRQLLSSGEHVKALVRAGSSRQALAGLSAGLPDDRLQIVEGDITVGHTVFRALIGCDRLYHVAAVNRLWAADPSPLRAAAVEGTREVLAMAKKRGIRKVVYTSSAVTLGTTSRPEEMDENHAYNLHDAEAYVQAKKEAEDLALAYARDEHLPLVIAQPTVLLGAGDWRPTPAGALLLRYLNWKSLFFGFPSISGGINVADVNDVAQGHVLCMEKGTPGQRYLLGGENLTYEQFLQLLADVSALPSPGGSMSKGVAQLLGTLAEWRARWTGDDPTISRRMARDYAGSYLWVSSAKAERELGYTHQPVRRTLVRAVQFFLSTGLVVPAAAARVRVDVRA